MRWALVSSLSLALVFAGACAGYAHRILKPRLALEAGAYEEAIADLEGLAKPASNDKLLYLLDLGMAYHRAGRYKESTDTFLQAEALADKVDHTSVSQEVGSVLLNDDAKVYGGEDFERLLIHVYLAIGFTLLGEWDSALVECRKVNHRLDILMREGRPGVTRNAFAKYLAAVLFESQREWNSAFVDYRQLRGWDPSLPYLGVGLVRMADRLQALQELAQFRTDYPDVKKLRRGFGEVVVLVEQGKAPVKEPSPQMRLVPIFAKRSYRTRYAIVRDAADDKHQATSAVFYNIERAAIDELNAKLAGIVAKKLAGVAAKEAVGLGLAKATDNQALGSLATLILHLSDKADLRSWTTLPATLQIARLSLPAGRRNIELDMVDHLGTVTRGVMKWPEVEISAGKIAFLNFRSSD